MKDDPEHILKQEEDVVDSQPSGQPQTAIYATPSDVPDYLAFSIFNTCCCCFVLGILGIAYSVQANSMRVEDPDRARAHANTAKSLNIAGLIIGVITLIVLAIYNVGLHPSN